MINSNESIPRIVYGRQQRAIPRAETPEQYWRVTVSIPLLDSIISELECRFSEDKMAHYELFNLMPQVISANEDLQSTESTIIRVWGDLIPFSDMLSMELKRWKQHCSGITCDKSITELLAQNTDPVFFPNIGNFSVFWQYYQLVVAKLLEKC